VNTIYEFYHDGLKYYGQGFNELEVRRALEYKLNLPIGTLRTGRSDLKKSLLKSISYSEPDLRLLCKMLRMRPRKLISSKVQFIIDNAKKNKQQVLSLLSRELNVDRNETDKVLDNNPDVKISDLIKISRSKILVKTFKIIKHKEVNRQLVEDTKVSYSNIVVREEYIDRVAEIKEYIDRLLMQDYSLIIDLKDPENLVENTKMSINKAKSYFRKGFSARVKEYSTKNPGLSIPEIKQRIQEESVKFSDRLVKLPSQLEEAEKLVNMIYRRNHNTFYYVGDDYLHTNYQQVMNAFNQCYEVIKKKMAKNNLNYIPYNDEFTLEEYLDSWWLISRGINDTVRVLQS
jgi:hypothetical protein